MREIKFRAWKKSEKRYVEWPELCDDEHILQLALTRIMFESIEQYTGLCDKNGKDIYEGDIVRDKTPETNWWDGVVTWHKVGSVGWVVEPLPKDKSRGAWGLNYSYVLEIIGTIHSGEKSES